MTGADGSDGLERTHGEDRGAGTYSPAAKDRQTDIPGTLPTGNPDKPPGRTEYPWEVPTQDDVIAAYRLMLGRRHESEEIIKLHLSAAPTIDALRNRFLSSPEFFRANRREIAAAILGAAPPSITTGIETDLSGDLMQELFAHVHEVWSKLGDIEPHYSVLSDKKFKPGSFDANSQAFYQSGEQEFQATLRRLSTLGLAPNLSGLAVELGSGVGRVTAALAAHFAEVVGYDVSAAHLDFARNHLSATRPDSDVEFVHMSSVERLDVPAFDFFYSRIVLQHNPPPVAKALLRHFLQRARHGAIAVFQLMTSRQGYTFVAKTYLEKMHEYKDQELHVLPQADVFEVLNECGFVPAECYRDTSLSGFDRVSTTFIASRR